MIWRSCGATLVDYPKNSVQNHHKKKFVMKSHSGSKIGLFRPLRSRIATFSRIKTSKFLHINTHSVQKSRLFSSFFCLDCRFCKHAKFSKVNAAEKFGVDFWKRKGAKFLQNQHKSLYYNHLAKPLKTRVFSAKNFLAQNFQNLEGAECSFSEQN